MGALQQTNRPTSTSGRGANWKTDAVDPQALFILETAEWRIVVGRAFVRMVVALCIGGAGAYNAPYWLPAIAKWMGLP
jgi:hypothetical protein